MYLCRRSAAPRPHPSPRLRLPHWRVECTCNRPIRIYCKTPFFSPIFPRRFERFYFPGSMIFFFSHLVVLFFIFIYIFFFYLRTVTILLFVIWPVCGDGPTIDPSPLVAHIHIFLVPFLERNSTKTTYDPDRNRWFFKLSDRLIELLVVVTKQKLFE